MTMSQNLNLENGTQTASIGTEHTLGSTNGAGVYVLTVNLKNMVNGDILILRAFQKVLTGDSDSAQCYNAVFQNKQGDGDAPGSAALGDVIIPSPPVVAGIGGMVFTLTQTAGTGRDFDWRIDQLS